MPKQKFQTFLVVEKDGAMRIPAEVVQHAGLKAGDKVLVQSSWGQLLLLNPHHKELIEQFIAETRRLGRSLKETDGVWEGMTLKEYFSLSDEQRAMLWNHAYAEACDELEEAEEIDVESRHVSAPILLTPEELLRSMEENNSGAGRIRSE